MKIATQLSYSGDFEQSVKEVIEMERVGLDLVWVAEAYGFDSPSLMGFIAAQTDKVEIGASILPIYTRTPTLIAMTAAGLDSLSRGRFHLGLGASGPQVVEGFHGVPYSQPLARTRDVLEICRAVWRREGPLNYVGRNYSIPLPAGVGTDLGKPLKMINHPFRDQIPIWIAALGEKNVEMTAELADGWIPFLFVPERAMDVWKVPLANGKTRRSAQLGELMITAGGPLAIGESEAVRKLREAQRPRLALYIGGMGAKGKNFYNDVACRLGFEEAATKIQDLYLNGKKSEAEAAVPDELLELTSLCGPKSYVEERISAFKSVGVTHLRVQPLSVAGEGPAVAIEALTELI